MGVTDRMIRLCIAVAVAVLYITHLITGAIGLVLLILVSIFFATSIVAFCPLYSVLGVNTCRTPKDELKS